MFLANLEEQVLIYKKVKDSDLQIVFKGIISEKFQNGKYNF